MLFNVIMIIIIIDWPHILVGGVLVLVRRWARSV
jgi:hypothetical protein